MPTLYSGHNLAVEFPRFPIFTQNIRMAEN
jgi:hypothetical protein